MHSHPHHHHRHPTHCSVHPASLLISWFARLASTTDGFVCTTAPLLPCRVDNCTLDLSVRKAFYCVSLKGIHCGLSATCQPHTLNIALRISKDRKHKQYSCHISCFAAIKYSQLHGGWFFRRLKRLIKGSWIICVAGTWSTAGWPFPQSNIKRNSSAELSDCNLWVHLTWFNIGWQMITSVK